MSVDETLLSYFGSPLDSTRRSCLSRTFGPMKRGSLRRITFSLLFSILSPSCVILPLSINNTGILSGIAMIILAFVIAKVSLYHLSVATYRNQIFDFYCLCYHILGKWPGFVIGVLMFFNWGILAVAYQVLLGIFIPHIYKPFSLKLSSLNEKMFTLILSNFFITLPLSMIKDLESMNVVKVINGIGITYIIIINSYQCAQTWPPSSLYSYYSINFASSTALSCAMHSFSGYYYLPQLQGILFEPTPQRSQKLIFRALSGLLLISLLMTISGLEEFSAFHVSWATISGEMMLAFNLIAVIPSTVSTLRNIICETLDLDPNTLG